MSINLNKLQVDLYNSNLERSLIYLDGISSEHKQYRETFSSHFSSSYEISDEETILKKICSSHLNFIADFHTYEQSSRNFIRILKRLMNQSKLAIGLEMIPSKYQYILDTYLSGELTEIEFLDSINYQDIWMFPWSHYKEIFDIAKENNIKLIGLNSMGSLSERDTHAGEVLKKYIDQYDKILVFFGELHLHPSKLPRFFSENYTIIHQNVDKIFWENPEISSKNRVFKLKENEFVIQSSPPWQKYESMIYWFESFLEDPNFDIHEQIIEKGTKSPNAEVHEQFLEIAQMLHPILHSQHKIDLEDFNILHSGNLDYLNSKISHLNPELESFLKLLIVNNQSFYLPSLSILYCPNYSINKLAFLCGIFLYQASIKNKMNWLKINMKNKMDIFNYSLAYSISGHLAAKIINPFRKCNLYKNHLHLTKNSKNKISKNVINILNNKENFESIIDTISAYEVYISSNAIGHMVSDYAYDLCKSENGFNSEKYEKIIFSNLENPNSNFINVFFKDLDYEQDEKRFF